MSLYRKKAARVFGTVAALLLVFLLLAACSPLGRQTPGEAPPTAPPPQGVSAQPEQKVNLAVYYVKMTANDAYLVREVHQVPATREVAKAALEELVNANPVTPGASRILPPATKIRGVNIREGLATVDFSRDVLKANTGASGEELGIQSIVNTLTEFPEIKKVSFLVEGKLDQEVRNWWGHVGLYTQPFERDLSAVNEPAIWVTSPVPGQKVASTLEVRGSARVFEAVVNARLLDDSGKILTEGTKTATRGAPERGDFLLPLSFKSASPGSGKLEVFWKSPKDGKEMDKVVVPITW